MADEIYTLQDPHSKQTYDFQLDHYPTVDESIQLIKREQLKRSKASTAQHLTNEQIEQEAEPLSETEGIKHEIVGEGKNLLNQATQSPVIKAWNKPNLQNIGSALVDPTGLMTGPTRNLVNSLRTGGVKGGASNLVNQIPLLPSLYRALGPADNTKLNTRQDMINELESRGANLGDAGIQAAMIGSMIGKVKTPNAELPEVTSPKLLKSGTTQPQLGTSTGDDFIDAEVVPNEGESTALAKRPIQAPQSINPQSINRPQVNLPQSQQLTLPDTGESSNTLAVRKPIIPPTRPPLITPPPAPSQPLVTPLSEYQSKKLKVDREDAPRVKAPQQVIDASKLMDQRDKLQTQLEKTTDKAEQITLKRQIEFINNQIHSADVPDRLVQRPQANAPTVKKNSEINEIPQALQTGLQSSNPTQLRDLSKVYSAQGNTKVSDYIDNLLKQKEGNITKLPSGNADASSPNEEELSNEINNEESLDDLIDKETEGNENEDEGTYLGSGFGALQGIKSVQPKYPGELESFFGGITKTLKNYPQTKDIGEKIDQVSTGMQRSENEYNTKLAEIDINKFNSQDAERLNKVLTNYTRFSTKYPQMNTPILKAAKSIHDLLEQVRQDTIQRAYQAGIPVPATKVGYVHDYAPMVREYAGSDFAKLVDSTLRSGTQIQQIWNDIKDVLPIGRLRNKATNETGYLGRYPGSPHILHRTGTMNDIQKDPRIYVPAYINSMNRVGWLRPLYKMAEDTHLNTAMPDKLRKTLDAAMGQIKNPQFDDKYLTSSLMRLTRTLQSTLISTKLFASPRLQLLHAGSLGMFAFPELGPKYTALSINRFLKNPKDAYNISDKYMNPYTAKPWKLRSYPEKVQELGALHNIGFRTAFAMSWNGALQKALDEGLKGNEAENHAARQVLDFMGLKSTLTEAPFLHWLKSSPIGGWFSIYHTIPYNLIENYFRAGQDFSRNLGDFNQWKKVMYYTAAGLTGYELTKKFGIPLFHFTKRMLAFETALSGLGYTIQDMYKGNWDKSWDDFIKFLEPSIVSGYKKGGVKGTILYTDQPKESTTSRPLSTPNIKTPEVRIQGID